VLKLARRCCSGTKARGSFGGEKTAAVGVEIRGGRHLRRQTCREDAAKQLGRKTADSIAEPRSEGPAGSRQSEETAVAEPRKSGAGREVEKSV